MGSQSFLNPINSSNNSHFLVVNISKMSLIPHRRILGKGVDALCQVSTPVPGPRHNTGEGGVREPELLELKRSSKVNGPVGKSFHKNQTVIRVTSRQVLDFCIWVE